MSVLGNNILAGASGQGGYFIDRSLRFRSSASAYLSRTPASAGNRKTWTWSGWVKFGSLTATFPRLFSVGTDANNRTEILFITNTNQIRFLSTVTGTSRGLIDTVAYLRDPSAWYHLVVSLDASSTTLTMYINGVQQTLTTSTAIANVDHMVNSTNTHSIGRYFGAGSHFDGYMTEVNFIDGQALDPTYFGEYNEDTGVWQPIKYTGTYGTNGFYLNFSDNTSTTTLGYDTSGNSNNWTANNISVTAGATYDSMTDVPTLTSEDAANYATLNAVSTGRTLANGNLDYAAASSGIVKGTIGVSSGKWYWEVTASNGSPLSNGVIGLCDINLAPTTSFVGTTSNSWGYGGSGTKYNNGTSTSYGATYAAGDIIGVAFDADAGTLTFYKNGVSQGQAYSGIAGASYCPAAGSNTLNDFNGYFNFGQRPFAYTPPAGFKSLNTYNLPDSTIVAGNKHFDVLLETGTGSARNVTGLQFAPDFLWAKGRNASSSHLLYDTVRGVDKSLNTNTTLAEDTTAGQLTSFNSNGYSLPNDTAGYVNYSGRTYAFWNWKANGSGVSNTDGSITSTVSANTTAGFSIVTYTGNGSSGATVGHGLGVTPAMIITKARSGSGEWMVAHKSLGNGNLVLNQTLQSYDPATQFSQGGLAAPNSSTTFGFVAGSGGVGNANATGTTFVAYCFADVEGFSKFGSYTGNGSSDGPFVYTGFRPAFILVKRTNLAEGWEILDTSRNTYNPVNSLLEANQSSAEITNTSRDTDYLANGFKVRNTSNAMNASGSTYIFAAFAENPFKNSLAR